MRRSGQKLEPTPKTRVNSGGQSYAQTFTWNELGLLQSETYPVCGHPTCTGSPGMGRRAPFSTSTPGAS